MSVTGFKSVVRVLGRGMVMSLRQLSLWVSLWFALLGTAFAQPLSVDEYRLKAAFIYNFTQYVEWPAAAFSSPTAALAVCVLGTNPFGDQLRALESRSYRNRPITVSYPKSVVDVKGCHVVYTDDIRNITALRDLTKILADTSVLTVSSAEGANDAGIGIGFVVQGSKLRWTLNLASTRRAQLKVSSKLIEIAMSVTGEPAP